MNSSTQKWTLGGAMCAALLAALWLSQRSGAPDTTDPRAITANSPASAGSNSAALEPPIEWDAPPFDFVDQHAAPVSKNTLRGSVWIANFIFTQCTSICPTMTAKMVLLQKRATAPSLRFVSFSVDPEHDSPEVLAHYAQEWSPGESRWSLLSTTQPGLRQVAAGMKLAVQTTNDPANRIIHSNRFILVDTEGRVRGLFDSDDDASMELLAEQATRLAMGARDSSPGATAGSTSRETDGKALFASLGCVACHADERLAPNLRGVFGRHVDLDGGASVLADAAYLRESIVDPYAKLVRGYGPTMPSYRAHLSDAQVDSLIAHLESADMSAIVVSDKSGAEAQPKAPPVRAVDPVCNMNVSAGEKTPRAEFRGVTYYFCCDDCRETFEKEPQHYIHE